MSQKRNEPRDDTSFIHEITRRETGPLPRGPIYMSQGELPTEAEVSKLYFDKEGAVIDSETGAAAMLIVDDEAGDTSYYVAVATSGPNYGHVYNPVGVFARADDLTSQQTRTGRRTYEFRKVAKDTFGLYVTYLQSRVPSQYLSVERMVLNA